jgi:hypothetical protein
MKFVDEQGRILNIYQQLTQLTDEHLLILHWGGQVKLDAETAVEVSKTLLRSSLAGENCAIAANFHVDPFAFGAQPAAEAARWLEGTLDYAIARGVPIWSAQEWLYFTEVRHDANLVEVQWNPAAKRVSFRVSAEPAAEAELTVMVPMRHGDAKLAQLEVDGLSIEHHERKVGGVSYGWVALGADWHHVAAIYD